MADHPYTQDRELSWLAFNDRVLSEAMDETVPLLERLKFAAIFTSNLDEFFMIRVGSLFDLENIKPDTHDVRSGMTPKEQLEAIYKAVRPLYRKREHICSLLSGCAPRGCGEWTPPSSPARSATTARAISTPAWSRSSRRR